MARKKFEFSVNNIGELRKAVSDMSERGIKLTTTLPVAQGRPPLRKLAQELDQREDVVVTWSKYFPASLLETPVINKPVPPDQVVYALTAKVRNKRGQMGAPVTVRITLAEVREIIGSSAGKVSNGQIIAAVCHKQSAAGKVNWTPSGIEVVGEIVREVIDTTAKPEKTTAKVADKPVKPTTGKPKGKAPAKPVETVSDDVNADSLDNIEHPADLVPA